MVELGWVGVCVCVFCYGPRPSGVPPFVQTIACFGFVPVWNWFKGGLLLQGLVLVLKCPLIKTGFGVGGKFGGLELASYWLMLILFWEIWCLEKGISRVHLLISGSNPATSRVAASRANKLFACMESC